MDSKEENKLVRETIKFPVRYDKNQQTVWDSKGMMVCDIRGWGKIQYMEKSEVRQDAIGEKIAKLLNEFEGDIHECPYEKLEEPATLPLRKKAACFEWD